PASRFGRPPADLRVQRHGAARGRSRGRRPLHAGAGGRARAHAMTSVLYLGCPAGERADAEKNLSAGQLSVVAAADLAAALQLAHDLRTHRNTTLMFAVLDERRPDLTTEAVLAGMADVFPRPLGGRRVASAIEREQRNGSRDGNGSGTHVSDDLYSQSPSMRDVMSAIADAAVKRAGVLVRGEEGTG